MKFRIAALAAALALPPAAAQAQGTERMSELPLGTPAATDVIPFTGGYTGPQSGHTFNTRVGALLSVPGSTQYMPFTGGTFTGPITAPAGSVFTAPTISSPTINGAITGTALAALLVAPPPIGMTTPAAGAFTTLTATGAFTALGSVRFNSAIYAGGSAGVTCSGPPSSVFAVTNGIVTHC